MIVESMVLDDMSSTHSVSMGCPCGGAVIVSKMLVFLARCSKAGGSRRMMPSRVPGFQGRDSPFSVSMVLLNRRYLGYRKVEGSMIGVSLGTCTPAV